MSRFGDTGDRRRDRRSAAAAAAGGHGASGGIESLDTEGVLAWLGALIGLTCEGPPVLVGRVLGGAIAARFAIEHGERIAQLILVDTLGLAPIEPGPRFGEAIDRYFGDPTEQTYDGLMRYRSYDFDALRRELGETWEHLAAYAVDRGRSPGVLAAAEALMSQFALEIPRTSLARINVPTTLIWGRHDLATPLRVAESASRALGWSLSVIEDAATNRRSINPPRSSMPCGRQSSTRRRRDDSDAHADDPPRRRGLAPAIPACRAEMAAPRTLPDDIVDDLVVCSPSPPWATIGALELAAVHIDGRLRVLRALADGDATPELGTRAGTATRYVREWLEQQTASAADRHAPSP